MGEPAIRDVPDTAFLVAAYRARETERPDALFRDPFAARLVGTRGPAILRNLPGMMMGGWTLVVRTVVIDALIQGEIASGTDVVLNLGAGLDTRPYRMELPASLRWVEADYPHMLELKERALAGEAPRCRLERIPADLASTHELEAVVARACAGATRVLVITEGLLPYLVNDEVAALAAALRRAPAVHAWIADYFSAEAIRYRSRHARHGKAMQNAPFRFDPGDWFAFFAERGWKAREVRYLPEEGRRLGRPLPLPLWIRALITVRRALPGRRDKGAMERFAGYALLERV